MIDFLTQRDKQLHIITNFIGLILWSFLMPLSCAIQLQLLIGIAKEVYDRAHPLVHTADVMDIVADVIGVYLGAAIVYFVIRNL